MKKLMTLPLVALMMVACGDKNKTEGDDISICDCVNMMEEMQKKMQDIDYSNEEAMKAIEEEYKDKADACQKLGEGKTPEEMEEMEKEAEECK